MKRRASVTALGTIALLAASASAAIAADPPAPTTGTPYAGPCQQVEAQAWWRKDGIVVPSAVGEHVHVAACVPTEIVDGTLTLAVDIAQHNGTGPIRWIRACREDTYCQRWSMSLGPCVDCSTRVYLPLNLAAWPTGTQELRLTANVSTNGDGLRQYQSSAWPIKVRQTSPCDRCSVFWTARGWYPDHAYANAGLLSPPSSVASGSTIRVKLGPGSGGKPTRLAGAYVDPRFHDGSPGIVVREWPSAFSGSLVLPTLAPGAHRLVLVSSDGFNAGVLAVGFDVP